MQKCPKCQHDNPDHQKICDECGTTLEPQAASAGGDGTPKLADKVSGTAKLVLIRGGAVGTEFVVDNPEMNIGRWDPDGGSFPEIDLTDHDAETKVSRKHARLFFTADSRYMVEDLGSMNGTYVNRGPRLLPGTPQEVKNNDEIIMGKTFFKFYSE